MSRFLISLDRACQVVVDTVRLMQGGEIFLPVLPATTIGTLANALYGQNYPKHISGIRSGGEKYHESMLSREERTRVHRSSILTAAGLMLVAPSFHSWTTTEYPVETVPEYSSVSIPQMTETETRAWLEAEGLV